MNTKVNIKMDLGPGGSGPLAVVHFYVNWKRGCGLFLARCDKEIDRN